MFCYQRSFGLPTEVITLVQFRALITAPETIRKVKEAREALAKGDKKTYDAKKKGLPLIVFSGCFEKSEKVFDDGSKKRACWRTQKYVCLNGLVVADYDHLEGDVRKIWEQAYARLSDEDKKRILFVYVTPSGQGLKVVFIADINVGNLVDNISDLSAKLGLPPDLSGKDGCRGAFLTTENDVILMKKELFTYENKAFAEKFEAEYRAGNSGATTPLQLTRVEKKVSPRGDLKGVTYHNVPYQKIVEAWLGDKKVEPGDRHRTSLVLADQLRYITDNDPVLIERILRETPFVKEIVEERNEDVSVTVKSAQGYEFLKGIPKRMQEALRKAGAVDTCSDPQRSTGSVQLGRPT